MTDFILVDLFLKGICGYIMQQYSIVIGMHAIARQPMKWQFVSLISIGSAICVMLIRTLPMLQFGVHMLLNCLITNIGCIFIAKIDIRKSVLASIIMMILVLLSELINIGVLVTLGIPLEQIPVFLQDKFSMAVSALPGNISLILITLVLYYVRVSRTKRKELSR